MSKRAPCGLRRDGCERRTDAPLPHRPGPRLHAPPVHLALRPRRLKRVPVRRVGRQVPQAAAACFALSATNTRSWAGRGATVARNAVRAAATSGRWRSGAVSDFCSWPPEHGQGTRPQGLADGDLLVLGEPRAQLVLRAVAWLGQPGAELFVMRGQTRGAAPGVGLGATDWLVRHGGQSVATVCTGTSNRSAISAGEHSWATPACTRRGRKSTDQGRGLAKQLTFRIPHPTIGRILL